MKKGGKLKSVDSKKNPGLAKLPTDVRNKMGYMAYGGKMSKSNKEFMYGRDDEDEVVEEENELAEV